MSDQKHFFQKKEAKKEPAKEKEIFQEIRKLRQRVTLRIRLIIFVTLELLISLLLALGVDALLAFILGELWTFPTIIELGIIGILVGIFTTYLVSNWLIDPINNVGPAMERIADGDYSVRLKTRNKSKEIQEIYSGFNMMAQELESTEIIQTDFISNVSHEFKTPISAIEGYSMLLQDNDNLTKDQKTYVAKIIYNTKRLSQLTTSILLLSKLENQSIVSNRTPFALDEQIRQSILAFENEWSKKDIDFDIDLDEVTYTGNEALMHHIWDNLISNAVKFTPRGGQIDIYLKALEDCLVFTISDEGPGIAEESQKYIFDKFYQGDSSHKQKGNGLGLALAKKIVDLEGGSISVENNPDFGCTFTVILNK